MEGAGLAPSLQGLSDAARRRPQRALVHDTVTPACAQPEVNFVILVPPGMSQGTGTLRREAMPAIRSDVGGGKWPAWSKLSPCSYRYEWTFQDGRGKEARTVRVKQCLPEFPSLVPLAAIHPSVGKTFKAFALSNSRVGWVGINAAGKRCAVFYSFGTLVEVAELAGQFAAEEMASFCSSLEPVSMAAVHMVENSPLCALSYFNRYCGAGRSCYSEFFDCQIASGLFRVRWPTPGSGVASWTDDLTVAEKWFGWPPGGGAFGRGARMLKQLKALNWRPDSICVVASANAEGEGQAAARAKENPSEVLLVCFPATGHRHQMLWLRRIRRWSGCALVPREAREASPGAPGDVPWQQTCGDDLQMTTVWVDAMGCGQVCCAWPNERTGPFEAIFWAADNIFLVQESPIDNNMEIRSQEFQQTARALAKAILG